jgi:hypothetical protein
VKQQAVPIVGFEKTISGAGLDILNRQLAGPLDQTVFNPPFL